MKTVNGKKEKRLEKKKKKSAALAQIMKLNDEDEIIMKKKFHRLSSSSNDNENSIESCSSSNDSNNRKNLKETKKHNKLINSRNLNVNESQLGCEPKNKKIKLDLTEECHERIENQNEISCSSHNRICTITITKDEVEKNSNNEKMEIQQDEITYITERQAKQKRLERHGPKIRLKELGQYASLDIASENRVPIFLTDVQHLVMSALIGNKSPFTPSRWFHLEKEHKLTHSLVLIIEGVSLFHYLQYETNFEQCNRIFNLKLDVVMPPYKEGRIIEELASIPITNSHKDELINKYGSLEAATQIIKDSSLLMNTLFPVKNENSKELSLLSSKIDAFPRTKLLLSAIQMVEEGYPLPLNGALANKYRDYVFTKDIYSPVTDKSPMYGVDCEMCRTITGSHELTRISIVDEDLKPVYETLVRPTNKIVDYLTQYSGITPEMMLNATKTLNEVQNDVRRILPTDAILVGQSLNSDLHAMKMLHPYVIDTSVIFNLTGTRRKKSKLQILVKKFLGEIIQVHDDGHDSLEDSRATMKLAKLKLANGLDFGDEVLKGVRRANEIMAEAKSAALNAVATLENAATTNTTADNNTATASTSTTSTSGVCDNILNHIVKNEKRTAVITSQEISSDLEKIEYKEETVVNMKKKSSKQNDMKKNNSNDDSEYKKDNDDDHKMNPSKNIHFYKLGGNKAAIRKTQEVLYDYDLTLSHLNIPEQRLEPTRIEKTMTNVDKWIGKLWESIAHSGLFIVLFGGAPGSPNGVAMVKIKKQCNYNSDLNNTEMPVVT